MKKVIFSFLGMCLLVLSSVQLNAQPSKGGTPPSFTNEAKNASIYDERVIPGIDINQVVLEDASRPGPLWAGRSIPVGLDMNCAGTWTTLPDGTKIWRLKLTSIGAKALAVCYENFYIPEGGKLYLYNESKTQIIGAYTSDNNPQEKLFSTELVQGSSVTLEYVAPSNRPMKGVGDEYFGKVKGNRITNSKNNRLGSQTPRLSISELAYVYKDVPFLKKYDQTKTTGWGTSLSCEVNVNCSEGSTWQSEKRGVAEIWLKNGSSWGWCTGDLVNTTNNSGTPYFLTADHCHSEGGTTASASDMLQWQFYFNYEASGCTTPSTEPSYNTITGCALKAASPINGGSDFCLVLLGTTPPQSYNPYYNGWNRTNTAPTSGTGISHPAGDIKKISTYTSTLTSATWNDGTNIGTTNAHWQGSWVSTTNGYGQIEGGSSGSPLFNSSHLQVGTLTGGTAANCSTGSSFDYGKFYYHWDQTSGGTTTQLKTWLDPISNSATTVNGYDPYAGYPDFYGTPTTIYAGNSVNFFDLTNNATSWSWQFEGGSPATSTVKNPTNIVYNQQGTYRVSLTTYTSVAGTQTMEKVGYITVLPGVPNISIWCDDFSTPANWTLINHSGVANQVWKIGTAAPTGSYSATNPGKIVSTSGGNYALFDSDGNTTTNVEQWASVSSNVGVNCTNYEGVFLKFQEAYTKFYDSTLVYVSTDNFTTSTRYVVNDGMANSATSGNPATVSVDITAAAAGHTNVKIRFTFRSTPSNMGSNAGWGYAWDIDDVCLEGVLPGHSLPQPDFTANTVNVPQGGSVNFTNTSLYGTSWQWTFEGGTPATSTLQNPTGIVYSTQGDYTVTLVATNANGYTTKIKTDYIHVFYDCRYTGNKLNDDDATYYSKPSPATWGYVPGHSGVGTTNYTAFADKITMTGFGTAKVKSLAVAVGTADVVGGATNVTFTVWNDNAGVPGTVLTTKVVAVKDLMAGYINYVDFAPVAVGTTFWVGFQLTYVASLDTFACYFANGGIGKIGTSYCYNGTSWTSMQTTFGKIGSLYILPEYCLDKPATNKPDVDFCASQTQIAPAASISFTDQSTGGPVPTSWAWAFPGTGVTPASSTVQNPPTVTYANAGLYNVTLNATNTNGSNSLTKVGYIHVSATSNIVYWTFPNNPDNATADGGISANTSQTITNWGAPTTQTYATAGATTRCASTTKWDYQNASTTYTPTYAWQVSFTTAGYTNIKLSSKQAAGSTSSPRDFAIYYSVNGGDYHYLAQVPAMTTASNWTQGVVTNLQMPSDCDNATTVTLVWYTTSTTSANGGTVTSAATSLIDDIYVSGMACTTLPAAAGTITGSATVCQGSTGNIYTVPTITSATDYVWSVPTGATITSGQYTNSITVSFAQNQAAGNIGVYGENICGIGTASSKAITLNPVPARPGPISGNQSLFNGQTGIVYSVPTVSGATSYTWTVPSYLNITAGNTTNSITTSVNCPGDYATLSVHANNACGASLESYVYTVGVTCAAPVADFMADYTNVVVGTTVNFTDLSSNNPSAWSWTFNGGTPTSSTVKNPSVLYSTPGTYDVTLTATNTIGNNSSTKTGYIVVSAAPVTIVTWNFPTSGADAIADGGITPNLTKTISVQGGVTAPTYATAGATTNCASAIGWATGSGVKYWQVSFVTTGYNTLKLSSKMAGNNIRSPRDFKVQYSLDGSTWSDVPNTTINCGTTINNWTNSAANLSSVALPAACENQASVYLRWIMTSNLGLTGSTVTAAQACLIDDIIVMGIPMSTATTPVANFTGTPTSICAGQSVTFTDASSNTPTSWSWTFTGGTPASSTTQNPTVTYNTAGTYSVSLTATNSGGSNTKTMTGYVTVNALPTVTISASPTSVCAGSSSILTASGGTSYTWDNSLGTGNPKTVTPTATTTYHVTGTDANGCSNSASTTVTVNTLPTVQTSTTTSACGGATGTATATASGGTGSYTYLWSNSQTTAIATNLAAGTYTVTVSDGNSCTVTGQATVLDQGAPVLTLNTTTATICVGDTVLLTVSGADSYTWSPAQYLNTITGSSVIAIPLQTITYTVSGTTGACTATQTVAITVTQLPSASFSYNASNMQVSFTNTSQNSTSWLWNFGDGNTDNTQNPTYTYTNPNSYTVSLVASNSCGSDTATQNIIIDAIVSTSVDASLNAYPNPNSGMFELNVSSPYRGTATVTVYDEEGRKILSKDVQKVSNSLQIPMDIKNAAKGVYRIMVNMGSDVIHANMVIDKP